MAKGVSYVLGWKQEKEKSKNSNIDDNTKMRLVCYTDFLKNRENICRSERIIEKRAIVAGLVHEGGDPCVLPRMY